MSAINAFPIQTRQMALAAKSIENALFSAANMPSAAGQLMHVLTHQLRDATVLIGSDSTGNEAWEWVYLLATKYATEFPSFTVEYYLWDVSNKQFPDDAEVISTGTGQRTLRIYNGAVGGSRPDYMLGERFEKFAASKNADLIICNYGHNFAQDVDNASYVNSNLCKYIEFIDAVVSQNPCAGCIVIGQSPQRTNNKMRLVVDAANKVAGLLNCDFVDVYSEFESQGKDVSLYLENDVVHPSPSGMALVIDKIWRSHSSVVSKTARTLAQVTSNNIIPEDVSNLGLWIGGSAPEGFVASANANLDRDLAVFGVSGSSSLKLSPDVSGDGNVFIQHALDDESVRKLRGRRLFVSMRFYRPLTATPVTSGKIEILLSDGTRIATAEHTNLPIGGWHERIISADIPYNETEIKLNFYADSSSEDSAATIYIDSIKAVY